jgi:hypothetical protein
MELACVTHAQPSRTNMSWVTFTFFISNDFIDRIFNIGRDCYVRNMMEHIINNEEFYS